MHFLRFKARLVKRKFPIFHIHHDIVFEVRSGVSDFKQALVNAEIRISIYIKEARGK